MAQHDKAWQSKEANSQIKISLQLKLLVGLQSEEKCKQIHKCQMFPPNLVFFLQKNLGLLQDLETLIANYKPNMDELEAINQVNTSRLGGKLRRDASYMLDLHCGQHIVLTCVLLCSLASTASSYLREPPHQVHYGGTKTSYRVL